LNGYEVARELRELPHVRMANSRLHAGGIGWDDVNGS
jgi:hypothetical protein